MRAAVKYNQRPVFSNALLVTHCTGTCGAALRAGAIEAKIATSSSHKRFSKPWEMQQLCVQQFLSLDNLF
eukprot:5901943-Amphidinium_carterae.1